MTVHLSALSGLRRREDSATLVASESSPLVGLPSVGATAKLPAVPGLKLTDIVRLSPCPIKFNGFTHRIRNVFYVEWGSHPHIERLSEAELLCMCHERNVILSTALRIGMLPLMFSFTEISF